MRVCYCCGGGVVQFCKVVRALPYIGVGYRHIRVD